MLAWLVLLGLVVGEVVAVRWWLHKEFYPVFFNGWAMLIYCAVLEVDFVAAWLASMLEKAGGTFGTTLLVILGLGLIVIVFLGNLFFRWVVAHDMTDISKR